MLREDILRAVNGAGAAPARVCSLACGPAREVLDVYAGLQDPSRLRATLVDIDPQAIGHVRNNAGAAGFLDHMTLVQGNLLYLAAGRQPLDVPPQDLVYSIGLIDYFGDTHLIALMNFMHRLLAPGGQAILGNFHPSNPSRGLMDSILDWQLIHRTADDMHRLFAASAFGQPCSRIRFEAAGVNLFASCHKGVSGQLIDGPERE